MRHWLDEQNDEVKKALGKLSERKRREITELCQLTGENLIINNNGEIIIEPAKPKS